MINFVIKKDGTKVPFDPQKIKSAVVAAAKETYLSKEGIINLTDKVLHSVYLAFESQEEVQTSKIREKVLYELDAAAPDVSRAWRRYERSVGKILTDNND